MSTPAVVPSNSDEDLAEQAVPGHGIPSQDPELAAQAALTPAEARREAKSVMTGGGVVGGAVVGAAIGAAVGGPVGAAVGGTLGVVAGAIGAEAAGASIAPKRPASR